MRMIKLSGFTAISFCANFISLGLGVLYNRVECLILGLIGLGLSAILLITDQRPEGDDKA